MSGLSKKDLAEKTLKEFSEFRIKFKSAKWIIGGSAALQDISEDSDIDIIIYDDEESRIRDILQLNVKYENLKETSSFGSFGKFKTPSGIYDFIDGSQISSVLPLTADFPERTTLGTVYFQSEERIWLARFMMALRGSKKQKEKIRNFVKGDFNV